MPTKTELFKDGYVIVPAAVPVDLCRAVVADIDAYVADGGFKYLGYGGMVEMYHYQSMWNVRQHPAVHAAFAELFETGDLWVSIDRCNYKEPKYDAWSPAEEDLGFIHWDINVNQRPRPFEVQGVVALIDTDPDMGGFQCIPEVYKRLDEVIAKLPNRKIVNPNVDVERWNYPLVRPAMKQGDLLIWDSFLPHGNGVNRSSKTRYAQYVTMFPPGDERSRQERTDRWMHIYPPSGWAFPGDPREPERKNHYPAHLSELGIKLLRG